MTHPAAETKVSNFIQEQVYPQFDSWLSDLIKGDLHEVEQAVCRLCGKLSDLLLVAPSHTLRSCWLQDQRQSVYRHLAQKHYLTMDSYRYS